MSTASRSMSVPDAESVQRMRFRRAMARKKRIEREQEGEISELNLTAMMDMMTIILVFLLKSFSATTVSMSASEDIKPPVSSTQAVPKDTIAVTITPKVIMVGDRKVVSLKAGKLPQESLNGRLVVPLDSRLKKEVNKLKRIQKFGGTQFSGELSIIADRKIPYDLLLTVLYTAGVNELDKYRFVVIKKDG